jgi:hypothetical protein
MKNQHPHTHKNTQTRQFFLQFVKGDKNKLMDEWIDQNDE